MQCGQGVNAKKKRRGRGKILHDWMWRRSDRQQFFTEEAQELQRVDCDMERVFCLGGRRTSLRPSRSVRH